MATATFEHFDRLIHECFSECTGVNTTKQSWLQAELSPHRGGLGLRSLSHHSTAAYISSLCNSECASPNHSHLASSIDCFNLSVMSSDTISIESCLLNKPSQHNLSDKLEAYSFSDLLDSMSCAHRARLLSVSSPHAAAWLTVTPSVSLGLHLDPNELHTAIKWWLGLCPYGATDVPTPLCALCPEKALDPLCHHSITCKRGSDVTNRHNRLRNTIFSACQRASLPACLEAGCGLGSSELRTRPADILVTIWEVKDTAAFDITVTSPLSPKIVSEAGVSAGVAAKAAESRKHEQNDTKCSELGRQCIPLAVETYGAWG